jgi:hypothetical protein
MALAGARSSTIYDLLSPPLILLTPFISFINHNDYSYSAPELWLCVAGLTALGLLCHVVMAPGGTWLRVLGTAGLLTLFFDLQFDWFDTPPRLWVPAFGIGILLLCGLVREHLSRITAPVFATMLAAGLLFQGGSSERSVQAEARRADAQAIRPAPPVVIHLIFDEFIGLEGIPPEAPGGSAVRHSLRSLLLENGFQVFGRAYSRFHYTNNAIPNMLNYASVPEEAYFTEGDHKRLRKNQYFRDMYERGYMIHVYQPGYIDFCEGYEHQIVACHNFLSSGIKPLETLQLSTTTNSELILRNFGELSVIWRTGARYYKIIMLKAVSHGYFSPQWLPGSPHLWSAHGLQILDTIARDVANAAPGDLYFAHLLTPHGPYVYDRSCNLRDPHDWVDEVDDWVDRVDPVSRLHRYMLYLEQVECICNRLKYVFELWRRAKVFDRAKIIIHGDHGSRLYLTEPAVDDRGEPRESDYVDSFSTLFAVKAPGLGARYDGRMVAIQDALAAVANDEPLDRLSVRAERPFVLLPNMRGPQMMQRPMPHFGDLPAE